MNTRFETNQPKHIKTGEKLNLPSVPKPIYKITFPVYAIPAWYEAYANDNGWIVEKVRGKSKETVAEKKFTNFERLRTLDIEQMADELFGLFAAFYDVEWSKEAVTGWLKQEVDDVHNQM